jgi:large subunit ribosomal protein L3
LETAQPQAAEEHAPAGLVDEGAVHEIPALPSDEEVAAIAAEQDAGAAADTSEGTDAEAGQATPESDESKEG